MPARSRLRTRVAAMAAVLLPVIFTASAATPPALAGWTQIWADNFNGPAGRLPSDANWQFDLGHSYLDGPPNWGTGEITAYTKSPANVSLDGAGHLRITPLRSGTDWTSARIETHRSDFKPPVNGVLRVEARIQLPNVTGDAALGYWPAFWMLGSPYRGNWSNWPGIGEFDIMENVNGINGVWGVLHCGVNPGGPCNENTGIAASRPCPGATCQSAFHTYRFEWDRSVSPNQLRWYVDGQRFHQVSQRQFDAGTWANMTNHAGYLIILNVAIGGAFPDALAGATPTDATVPGRPMFVDYVAVWTRGGTPPPAPPRPPPTCGQLISQDRPVSANEPNWIQVDLGRPQPITRVRLNWGTAHARTYAIQLSTNATTWTDAYITTNGGGGIEDLNVSGTARYVRMIGINKATAAGFSLSEFEIFGACSTTKPPPPPPPTPEGSWEPNTPYAVGAQVSYGGGNYRCLQAHTSIISWEPTSALSLWQPLKPSS